MSSNAVNLAQLSLGFINLNTPLFSLLVYKRVPPSLIHTLSRHLRMVANIHCLNPTVLMYVFGSQKCPIEMVLMFFVLFWVHTTFCLFDLILYIPVNNLSVMLGWVFLGWSSSKQGLMCLAQGHNALMLVRLEPAALRSPVKHSTTNHCPPLEHTT